MPIEDFDYFIRLVVFPNASARALIAPNDDGTFSMYIDARLSREEQIEAYIHELEHILNDDFYVPKPRCL